MKTQPEQIVKPYSPLLTCPQNAKKQMSWAVYTVDAHIYIHTHTTTPR